MIPGLTSESARAASTTASARSAMGRRHFPVIRSLVTWTATPAGACRWNCGSANRLTAGTISPMRLVMEHFGSVPAPSRDLEGVGLGKVFQGEELGSIPAQDPLLLGCVQVA